MTKKEMSKIVKALAEKLGVNPANVHPFSIDMDENGGDKSEHDHKKEGSALDKFLSIMKEGLEGKSESKTPEQKKLMFRGIVNGLEDSRNQEGLAKKRHMTKEEILVMGDDEFINFWESITNDCGCGCGITSHWYANVAFSYLAPTILERAKNGQKVV